MRLNILMRGVRTVLLEFKVCKSMPTAHICLQAEVRTLERVSERIKGSIRDIDSRVTRISQTATRIGDRLQVRWNVGRDMGQQRSWQGSCASMQPTNMVYQVAVSAADGACTRSPQSSSNSNRVLETQLTSAHSSIGSCHGYYQGIQHIACGQLCSCSCAPTQWYTLPYDSHTCIRFRPYSVCM
jgi:hypothetical protein